jgi:hypothetical protein
MTMLRCARRNNSAPTRSSSRAISLLTADGVMARFLAAAEKLPSSAARTKTCISV